MNNVVKKIDDNLVLIKDILSVNIISDEICDFDTKQGNIKIFGNNLEILKYVSGDGTIILNGLIYKINY